MADIIPVLNWRQLNIRKDKIRSFSLKGQWCILFMRIHVFTRWQTAVYIAWSAIVKREEIIKLKCLGSVLCKY